MSFTWKIFSFTPDYLPRLDHNKIISNHNAATCELSTRSIGKFTEKLISCQGHFHCELSTRGIGKFTEKLISCQGHFQYRLIEFQPFKENIYIPLCPNALVSTTSTITGSWSEKLHVPTWAHIL